MEPVYMALGHAAAVAAHLPIFSKSAVQDIDCEKLCEVLIQDQ
jgi:hypothetical protein